MLNVAQMSNDSKRRAEFVAYFNKAYGGDRQLFLSESGISKGRATQYFDESEPFGERAAASLEKRLDLEPGTIFKSLRVVNGAAGNANNKMGIPVVGTAQLGDDGYFYDLSYPVGHGDGYLNWPTKDANAYAVRCKGESMKPRIRHNEFAVLEPNHPYAPGDEVLVKDQLGRVMIKQLAYIRDGMVHLDSVNETFQRISIEESEIVAIHFVAGIAKSALWREAT